jgi:hypothetical protein
VNKDRRAVPPERDRGFYRGNEAEKLRMKEAGRLERLKWEGFGVEEKFE